MKLERKVNNEIYRQLGHCWWDDEVGEFSTIRYWVNPVRFGYFERILKRINALETGKTKILDVGCGGGLLSEEFSCAGYMVTGVDPAPETIATAKVHASLSGLQIDYLTGFGEHLPFPEGNFDHVICCDVLEHVDDLNLVIAEISRVLKPGGLFLYDTINRTLASKVAIIKVMQDWKSTSFAAPNSHIWEKFIKPSELVHLFNRHNLKSYEMRGIVTKANPISILSGFRLRKQGSISFQELGRRLNLQEGKNLKTSYMGYALKGENSYL